MKHDPFKQLEFTANERVQEAPKPVGEYPKHVNFPDGSYKVAHSAEDEAKYTAEAEGIAPSGKRFRAILSKLGL